MVVLRFCVLCTRVDGFPSKPCLLVGTGTGLPSAVESEARVLGSKHNTIRSQAVDGQNPARIPLVYLFVRRVAVFSMRMPFQIF